MSAIASWSGLGVRLQLAAEGGDYPSDMVDVLTVLNAERLIAGALAAEFDPRVVLGGIERLTLGFGAGV